VVKTWLEFNLSIYMFIYWLWPVFLPSTMTVTHKFFKILSGHGFCIKCFVTLTFDLVTSKFLGVIYWPCPIYLTSTTTVTQKLFKILSWHDVANGRIDRQADGRHTTIRPKFHFGRIKSHLQQFEPCGFVILIKCRNIEFKTLKCCLFIENVIFNNNNYAE